VSVYAIGDVQGCYSDLLRLLEKIRFDPGLDQLWFSGDLVNRGPESLQTLQFVRSLGDSAISVLGNHDLHLLAVYHGRLNIDDNDSLAEILRSPECEEILHWLRWRPLLHYDPGLQFVMVHAGIHCDWSLEQATSYAGELERVLRSDDFSAFFKQMYGDKPDRWTADLEGMDRWRCITNIFTRQRFLATDGRLDYTAKGSPTEHAHQPLVPWYELNRQLDESIRVVFGHWSTLPVGAYGNHYAVDSGCVWGGKFTALKIDGEQPEWFSVDCKKSRSVLQA
jgi:bis(5'-nucleosyl)-tetraphosphatase (symmetrical)